MDEFLGKRIKALRDALSLSQDEVAEMMAIDRSTVSLIENGKRSLKAGDILLFTQAFNITVRSFLDVNTSLEELIEQVKSPPLDELNELRIAIPKRNLKKFKELLLYILGKVGAKPNVGETVLYKLLYFIDFNYYEKYEEPLTGATYIKNFHGPSPVDFKVVINEMIKNKEVELIKIFYFHQIQKKYLPYRAANLSIFNGSEIQVIDDVLYKLSDMSARAISEYSHQDVPWMITSLRQKIKYETVFGRTPAYSVREYHRENTGS